MKDRVFFDLEKIMDEIFEATKNFGDFFQEGFKKGPNFTDRADRAERCCNWDENVDFYPAYSYPPCNVYLTKERNLVFEFAMAGFSEESIDLQFQGDNMVLSAKEPEGFEYQEGVKYFKRRLKFKEIREQKYFVPEDKFDRERVKAVFKTGILKVTIPPKESFETKEGIKIEIVKEGE